LLNRIEKCKSFVYGDARFELGRLVVPVEPRRNGRPVCSGCGRPGPCHDRRSSPRLFEYVPLWGIPVVLSYRMRRVNCPRCGIVTEDVPWARGNSPLTRTYTVFLARWARRLSWAETAQAFGTSWQSVHRSVKWVVDWGLQRRDLSGITAIGVDEVHVGRDGFITVLYQIDKGARRLLGVAQGKSADSLRALLEDLAEHVADIRFVCSDLSRAYRCAISSTLGEAVHVLDRFHLVKNLNEAVDQVRRQEARELARKGANPLAGSRYCFLKNPARLTEKQKTTLGELVALGLRTVRAYHLKESFQALWAYDRPAWARKFLRAWCARAMRSRLEPVKKFVRSVRAHEELLLNWFEAKKEISNGVVEGLNRKINLITRKSYGFRSAEIRQTALFHALGSLPEPELTHHF